MLNLVDVGFRNLIPIDKIIYVAKLEKNNDNTTVQRKIETVAKEGKLLKATCSAGRRSAIFMKDGWVVISSFTPETIAQRIERKFEEQRC